MNDVTLVLDRLIRETEGRVRAETERALYLAELNASTEALVRMSERIRRLEAEHLEYMKRSEQLDDERCTEIARLMKRAEDAEARVVSTEAREVAVRLAQYLLENTFASTTPGYKIGMIRVIRHITGLYLKEAKTVVDEVVASRSAPSADKAEAEVNS